MDNCFVLTQESRTFAINALKKHLEEEASSKNPSTLTLKLIQKLLMMQDPEEEIFHLFENCVNFNKNYAKLLSVGDFVNYTRFIDCDNYPLARLFEMVCPPYVIIRQKTWYDYGITLDVDFKWP